MSFLTFLGIKVNFVEKGMESTYLCVILHGKRKKTVKCHCFYLIPNS